MLINLFCDMFIVCSAPNKDTFVQNSVGVSMISIKRETTRCVLGEKQVYLTFCTKIEVLHTDENQSRVQITIIHLNPTPGHVFCTFVNQSL